jgi:hypothetical protein
MIFPLWEFQTASADARQNAFMRSGFLPMHHRDAAVEFRGELHTFVHVDHTPLLESRAAINVVAACKHAAFSEVFSSLVMIEISRLATTSTSARLA